MASTADIKNGVTINLDGQLFNIIEFLHVKPGKGGAFVRTKLKNVISGRVLDRTFRSGEKIDIVKLEDRKMQYLYREGDSSVFMDQETFDQVHVSMEVVGENEKFMKEGEIVTISFHEEKPITFQLPFFINFMIAECEPGHKGDTVSNITKSAEIETGATVQVPLFVEKGDQIRVDTRTGEYIERVRK